jgi:hypothetical protein
MMIWWSNHWDDFHVETTRLFHAKLWVSTTRNGIINQSFHGKFFQDPAVHRKPSIFPFPSTSTIAVGLAEESLLGDAPGVPGR